MVPDELRFERFDKTRHDRQRFDCGDTNLNDFLKTRLNQQMRRGITVGYVLATPGGRIAGYVTLSNGELPIGVIPEGQGFPVKLPLPTTLIGRLAVDREFQGHGLGSDLLVHAIRIAVQTAEQVASAVIEVDALNERARDFYSHFGFVRLPDDELHLYMPMADARELVQQAFGTGD
jgi:ribosomal protein S18 acetylase RimI-like enzyme